MLGLDGPRLDTSQGEALPLGAYRRDFRERQWTIDGQDSWKLERGQHFREPGFTSWEAFARGDWDGSLRLIEEERDYLREFSQEVEDHRITLYRVRVVEQPITPYLQWELHLLRLRAECGERIRVVGPEHLADLERSEPLPELLTLGDSTTYRIRYTDQGILDGAVRFTDAGITSRCRALTRDLYDAGEDLESYFAREVAHLPPPQPE
ncbi:MULTISPECIES: DUF6879 family protein [Streptomyces violaceusniger group]|uniref:DUF6879 domain-containing protein n=1 Tax=Streptomyces rhizosphaericus TaxID=114699 RepID=A0A6G4AST8_9ACTN|nr:DUF6879 family protein [Streptomyces rhizosphaericus]NEW75844.1 hypothetical protein [Streptomyces rhizosphaericus]